MEQPRRTASRSSAPPIRVPSSFEFSVSPSGDYVGIGVDVNLGEGFARLLRLLQPSGEGLEAPLIEAELVQLARVEVAVGTDDHQFVRVPLEAAGGVEHVETVHPSRDLLGRFVETENKHQARGSGLGSGPGRHSGSERHCVPHH
jgi:hypothetical protein